MKRKKERSQGSLHFWDLCADKSLTQPMVIKRWKEWCSTNPDAAKVHRNVALFFAGAGIGKTTRAPVVEFCREALGILVEDTEFDFGERFTDHVGKFARHNSWSEKLLQLSCGEYYLFRPRIEPGSDELLFPGDQDELLGFAFTIYPEGQSGRYAFRLWHGRESTRAPWEGPVLCSGQHLYLVGFSRRDALSMILTPLNGETHDVDILVGAQFGGLVQRKGRVQHERVAGRATAAARKSAGYEDHAAQAKNWLSGHTGKKSAGFVLELRQFLVEDDAS